MKIKYRLEGRVINYEDSQNRLRDDGKRKSQHTA